MSIADRMCEDDDDHDDDDHLVLKSNANFALFCFIEKQEYG